MRRPRFAAPPLVLALALALACASVARAAPPVVPLANQPVTLDGTPLGAAIATRSSYPTILSIGGVYHMWVQVQDSPAASLRIASFRHATSTDGLAFTTQGPLSFAGDPFAATLYGSTFGEPPWVYPRASGAGPVTFQFWTYNTPPDVTGDYNYNLSINTIAAAGTHALTHHGPVGDVPANGIAGQTAGGFGIAGSAMYYDNNSSLGRAALALAAPGAFPATANTGPWYATATNAAVYSPLPLLGFTACHLGGDTYMHNAARVVDNGDGTLGFFFTLRNCDGSRKNSQVYYAESADDGLTWGAPVGLFSGAATIGGASLQAGYSLADVVVRNGQRIVYFNAFDTNGTLVVGALPPVPPSTAQVPVPVDAPVALMLLALALAVLGLRRTAGLRRARRQ